MYSKCGKTLALPWTCDLISWCFIRKSYYREELQLYYYSLSRYNFFLWQTQSNLDYWNVTIACLFGPDPYLIFSLSALKLMIKGIIQLWWLLLPHVHVWLLSRQQEIFTHRKFGKVRYLVSAIQDVRMEDCEPQSALLLVIQVSSVSLHTVLCSAFFPYPIRRNLMWHDCGSISLQQL